MPRALAFIAELAVGDRRLHRGSPTLGGANECTDIRLRTAVSPNAFGMMRWRRSSTNRLSREHRQAHLLSVRRRLVF